MKTAGSTAAAVLLVAGLLGGTQAFAQIANTKHNLGSTGTGTNSFSGTGEICVFCHTPHGADTSASVPLWNRTLATANSYTTYNSLGTSSLDGATAPVGSVSLACLSCHDGTQAMSTMINTPGSGTAALSGTWTGANQSGGTLNVANQISNIGADLRNDHPIGIQYAGGMTSGNGTSYPLSSVADGYYRDEDFKGTQYANLNGSPVWWVDTGGTGRQKTDMMLYTRSGAVALSGTNNAPSTGDTLTGAQAFVECASCHDPHTNAAPTFLRISNTGSAVCLACHIK